MSHFVVQCMVYPSFLFISQSLRKLRKERGDAFPTGTVRFWNGILDTKVQGFDDDEAVAIKVDIKKLKDRPTWGVDIVEPGQPITGIRPDGRNQCPACGRRFETMTGLGQHLISHDGRTQPADDQSFDLTSTKRKVA